MTTPWPLQSPPPLLGTTRPRLWTPTDGTTTSDAVRVLRTASRSGLLPSPIPYQVWVHARIAERRLADARRRWRKAGLVVGRGNGKTDGVLAPYILDSLVEGVGVLALAQNLTVAMDTFTKVADTVEGDPHLSRRIPPRGIYRGKGQARLQLRHPATGQVATYRVSVSAKGCRGPRAPRLAVDEAAYVANDVFSAARYVQNGSGQVGEQQVLAVCTAGDDSEDARGDLQWFARWRAAYLEGTDPDLLWMEYSLPDGADFRDRSLWPLAVPALGYFVSEVEVADNLDDPAFVQEALSRWGVTSQRAIPADLWAQRQLVKDPLEQYLRTQPPIVGLGVAVTPEGTRAALAAAYRVPTGQVVKLLDDREGWAWAVQVAQRWTRQARVPVLVDARGPAGPLADALQAAGVHTEVATTDAYANACAAFDHDLRQGSLWHLGQPGMDAAAASTRWRTLGERRVWARRAGEIAAVEAATLAASWARHARVRPSVG